MNQPKWMWKYGEFETYHNMLVHARRMEYGKSLCHAWGAGPVYLLGRYWLGVSASSPGYTTYTVEPYLGGFSYIKGTVPVKGGNVYVYADQDKVTVRSDVPGGTFIWHGKRYDIKPDEEITVKSEKPPKSF